MTHCREDLKHPPTAVGGICTLCAKPLQCELPRASPTIQAALQRTWSFQRDSAPYPTDLSGDKSAHSKYSYAVGCLCLNHWRRFGLWRASGTYFESKFPHNVSDQSGDKSPHSK